MSSLNELLFFFENLIKDELKYIKFSVKLFKKCKFKIIKNIY